MLFSLVTALQWKPGREARRTGCSLAFKFIGKNANDSFRFILLTDCAGGSGGLLPAPVIAAAWLLGIKGLPPFRWMRSSGISPVG